MTALKDIRLAGLSLGHKTTNENGQSNKDCGALWQKFEKEDIMNRIPGRLSDEIIAVYHNYEGDHSRPFSYFIGCKVDAGAPVPEGLASLSIPAGSYQKFVAKGKMPDCVADTWKNIWNSGVNRSYKADFEVYDERSKDWSDAEVDIFISLD